MDYDVLIGRFLPFSIIILRKIIVLCLLYFIQFQPILCKSYKKLKRDICFRSNCGQVALITAWGRSSLLRNTLASANFLPGERHL